MQTGSVQPKRSEGRWDLVFGTGIPAQPIAVKRTTNDHRRDTPCLHVAPHPHLESALIPIRPNAAPNKSANRQSDLHRYAHSRKVYAGNGNIRDLQIRRGVGAKSSRGLGSRYAIRATHFPGRNKSIGCNPFALKRIAEVQNVYTQPSTANITCLNLAPRAPSPLSRAARHVLCAAMTEK